MFAKIKTIFCVYEAMYSCTAHAKGIPGVFKFGQGKNYTRPKYVKVARTGPPALVFNEIPMV